MLRKTWKAHNTFNHAYHAAVTAAAPPRALPCLSAQVVLARRHSERWPKTASRATRDAIWVHNPSARRGAIWARFGRISPTNGTQAWDLETKEREIQAFGDFSYLFCDFRRFLVESAFFRARFGRDLGPFCARRATRFGYAARAKQTHPKVNAAAGPAKKAKRPRRSNQAKREFGAMTNPGEESDEK